MPRGTTQVVTRGASNDCMSDCAGGRYEVAAGTLDGDTWHWRVLVQGTVAVLSELGVANHGPIMMAVGGVSKKT
ncbi:hypothetical protein Tco_1283188 [Tanacetum coccineum]